MSDHMNPLDYPPREVTSEKHYELDSESTKRLLYQPFGLVKEQKVEEKQFSYKFPISDATGTAYSRSVWVVSFTSCLNYALVLYSNNDSSRHSSDRAIRPVSHYDKNMEINEQDTFCKVTQIESLLVDDCDKSIPSFQNTTTVEETILHGGQYSTIKFNQKGLFYHSEDHGVTVIIPENAVKGPATMQFTASRLWTNFKCAKGSYEPVSRFVYICTKDKLSEPAQVHIPHYIDGDDKKNIVILVKGHKENDMFEVLENSKFHVNQATTCVEMKHFCVLCLAAAREGKPKKQRYHVLRAEKTTQYTKDVQICILYNPQCFQGTRKYFKSNGYTSKPADEVEGDIFQKGISISDVKIPDGRWTWTEIGRINKKITEKNIDMFVVLECTPVTATIKHDELLERYENDGYYPPRFHLQFENTTHQATDKSCPVTITLTGFDSGDFSFKTILGEQLDRQNHEEKDPFLIELMPYIEAILYDDIQTYYQFGAKLGLTIDLLTQLEYKFPDMGNMRTHIMEMLLKWRDSSQSVSHHKISQALHTCGYPILCVILENRFSYECKPVDGGDCEIVDKGRQLNGYQIIAEKLRSIDTGNSDLLLQKPNLVDFQRFVIKSTASKWKPFARQVELDGNAVEAIEKDNNGMCSDCFIAVLDNWKKRKSPPFTWETVLSVLYSDTVRGYKAGERVYQHLMHTQQKSSIPVCIVKTKTPRLSSSF